jgi:hypothetical protein
MGAEMTTIDWRRRTLTLGALAVGVPAAALLTATVASADSYDWTPDIASFVPTQVEGYPPLINEVTGTELYTFYDLTSKSGLGPTIDGVDTNTTVGSFTNDDFLETGAGLTVVNGSTAAEVVLPTDTQIDLANFGGGFGNEWVDIPSGPDAGTADLLITPFGDVPLFGSFFAELAAVGVAF